MSEMSAPMYSAVAMIAVRSLEAELRGEKNNRWVVGVVLKTFVCDEIESLVDN